MCASNYKSIFAAQPAHPHVVQLIDGIVSQYLHLSFIPCSGECLNNLSSIGVGEHLLERIESFYRSVHEKRDLCQVFNNEYSIMSSFSKQQNYIYFI